MKKFIKSVIAFVFIQICFFSFSYGERDIELESRINAYLEDKSGNFSFYVIDPKTGDFASINEEKKTAASIIKTYLFVEVHKQIKEGKISFDDRLTLKDKYRVNGSGILAREKDGTKYSVKYLLNLVITISDNVAANMLADYVGLQNINKTIESFGLENSKFGHLILPAGKTLYFYGWNETTAKDLATIYQKIYTNTCLGPEYDQMLIDLFRKCKSNYKIPILLPKGTKVSHKTGSLPLYEHDAGIVFSENRDYIIACMSNELKSNKDGQKTIAKVSRIVYDYMMEKDKKERTGSLKKINSKLVLNGSRINLYDFQGKIVGELNELLNVNLVLEEKEGVRHLYRGSLENQCKPDYYILDKKIDFNDKIGTRERNRIVIDVKITDSVFTGENEFIYLDDLYELGEIKFTDNNYYMELYAGNIIESDEVITLLEEEIIYYNVDGEIYVPLGYYYYYKMANGKPLIKKYTEYLLKKKNNEIQSEKAKFINFSYLNDVEKFDILSVGGNFVINIKELK